jgi:hypothetical protein
MPGASCQPLGRESVLDRRSGLGKADTTRVGSLAGGAPGSVPVAIVRMLVEPTVGW